MNVGDLITVFPPFQCLVCRQLTIKGALCWGCTLKVERALGAMKFLGDMTAEGAGKSVWPIRMQKRRAGSND